MSSVLNPYLGFRDTARQALDFYQSVFGGEIERTTFGEFQMDGPPDLIMHSKLTTPSGFVLMASDTPATMDYTPGNTITVSLGGTDGPELTGYWEKLIVGGTIGEPLTMAPWGDSFGMCVDKFGVPWMVNIAGSES
ncbi:MAG: PhnB protein [Microbacteriaceae bacterium]|nr:PhnB protein [Microbacteriaceae bacterium]